MISMDTANNNGEPSPVGVSCVHGDHHGCSYFVVLGPVVLAGYALLKRKRWAKTMGLIAAIVAGLNFPLGSALCVYTLWFLFGESGRFLYHKAALRASSWRCLVGQDRRVVNLSASMSRHQRRQTGGSYQSGV